MQFHCTTAPTPKSIPSRRERPKLNKSALAVTFDQLLHRMGKK
nr:MAG TPA: hypothetical protein [Caudoviricetes sp.]